MNKSFEQERKEFFAEFKTKDISQLKNEKENLQEYIQEITDAQDFTKPLKNEEYLRSVGSSNPRMVEQTLRQQRSSLLEHAKYLPEDKKRLSHLDAYIKEHKSKEKSLDRGLSM